GRIPGVDSLEIQAPFTAAGFSDTPSRQRIFVCRPKTAAEELPCATMILSTMARRAYRRPVTDQDLSAPLAFYTSARAGATFDAGIQGALPAILASPKFLYRAERTPAGTAPGTVHRI